MLLQLTNKFLHRVRIHGGEFDSSARAMNRAEQGDLFQADLRIVRGSTFERKQMSTTIKRIALVAVAALSLGVVSVAPSQAAANTLIKFTSGDGAAGTDLNTGNGVAGAFNYVTVTAETWSATSGNDYVITTDSSFLGSTAGTISTDKKTLVGSTVSNAIQVATPAVGTVTVSYWKRTAGVLASTAAETVVITVNASKQAGSFSAANSTSYIVAGETNTAWSATADATVTGLATANVDTATATIAVSLADALKAAYNDTVTATVISGGANVRVVSYADSVTALTTNVTAGAFSASALSTSGKALVFVHANGTSGPTQVKLTLSDGTVLATKSLTFSSTTVATLTPTVVYGYINGTKTGAITVVAKDASGYVVPGAVVAATSGDTTKISSPASATTDSKGVATFDVTAVAAAAGAATITFKTGVATTTASVTAAGVKATKLAITADVASAEAGSKVTYTLTVADANGPLADGDYVGVFFSAPVTSNGGTGAFAADTVTVLNGKATSSVYVPFVSGTYTNTWTLKGTAGTATTNLDAALTATTVAVSVAVTNAGVDAATDAANEAAQAASDATDAALAAADAADAATTKAQEAVDAVATLSAEVSKLITALKAQITTLTNLVIKIQKKVKA